MAVQLSSVLGVYGITQAVIAAGVYLVMKARVPGVPAGPAASAIAIAQMNFRAAYLVNAVVRLQNSVNAAVSLSDALGTEARFYGLHVKAQDNRADSARRVDQVSGGDPDQLLIWDATLDKNTTPECAAADGLTFTASTPPIIGYPGAVHVQCRCDSEPAPPGYAAPHVNTAMTPALSAH
jgi:hypothetical protein